MTVFPPGHGRVVERLLQRRTISLQINQVTAEYQNLKAGYYHTCVDRTDWQDDGPHK
jgi:hypothetical protein